MKKPLPAIIASVALLLSLAASAHAACARPLHVLDYGIPRHQLRRTEDAIADVANRALRWHWHTPRICFARTGWRIYLIRRTGPLGSYGYHSVDPAGNPYAVAYGIPLSVGNTDSYFSYTLSHEVFETLVDPSAVALDGAFHREIADPVVGDETYGVDGIYLADWVYPSWFVPHSHGPWDAGRVLASAGDFSFG
jgi:hypothetical protein